MKRLLLRVLPGAFSLMILCACGAGGVAVKQERLQRTGIGAQEKAAIVLDRYARDGQRKESEGKEKDIVDCLREAMRVDGPLIETVSGYDFRTTLFPGMKFENAPRDPEALLELLRKEEGARERVLSMTVRYILVVDIEASSRRAVYRATVLDAKTRAKAGELSVDAAGGIGTGLGILSLPERAACSGLGKAVYHFILSEEGPAPAKTQ